MDPNRVTATSGCAIARAAGLGLSEEQDKRPSTERTAARVGADADAQVPCQVEEAEIESIEP